MSAYVAEMFVPGLTESRARVAADRLRQGAARLAADGIGVRFLGVTFMVDDQALLCHWESATEQAVRAIHELAGLGSLRMVRSVDIAAADAALTPTEAKSIAPSDGPNVPGRSTENCANSIDLPQAPANNRSQEKP